MDQLTTDIRKQSWMNIISECNSSSLSKREWLEQNNVNSKSFYYWQNKLRREAALKSGFAEITVKPQSFIKPDEKAAVIEAYGMHIEIMNTATEGFLQKLIRSFRNA